MSLYSHILLSGVFACSVLAHQSSPAKVDPLLGEPFLVEKIAAGNHGQYAATLIRYPFGSSKVAVANDSVPVDSISKNVQVRPKAAILYIHGFNDYYFQRELAEKSDSAGFAFYAIDLHNYGRSAIKGEPLGYLRSISEYYPELDSALSKIQQIEGAVPQVIMGHSTGGLIAAVYAQARESGKNIAAIVLNSPFFEMNIAWPIRKIGMPLISAFGAFFPNVSIPRGENDNYGQSLYKRGRGEWDFDTTLKVMSSIPVDFGWAKAIHEAHLRVQLGMSLVSPTLVMYSSCSTKETEWVDEYTHCDGVLNVEDIREYGATLGPKVQLQEIQGGLHDLFLSSKPVRDYAYQVTFDFLNQAISK